MSIVIKRTGRRDNREVAPPEESTEKWRLTLSRERYPTAPVIVRKAKEQGDKPETPESNGCDSAQ